MVIPIPGSAVPISTRCLSAADVIDARYRADVSGDGPLAILAEPVRATALAGLRDIWGQLVAGYVGA